MTNKTQKSNVARRVLLKIRKFCRTWQPIIGFLVLVAKFIPSVLPVLARELEKIANFLRTFWWVQLA
jgi:hypothetical protein